MALTAKQERFCREYVVDHNATQAAVRAGYSPHTANEQGARLLANVSVQARLAELTQVQAVRLNLKADDVLRELMRVGFSDPRKLYRPDGTLKPPHEWDDDTAAAVSGVESDESTVVTGPTSSVTTRTHKVKRWDKLSALDKLGRHLRLFDEALQITGPVVLTVLGPGVRLEDL